MNSEDLQGAGLATRAIHSGEETDPHNHAHAVPIFQTATFGFSSMEEQEDVKKRALAWEPGAFLYTRNANPTSRALEHKVSDLEGAETSLASASGMGALAVAMLSSLDVGDHMVIPEDIYFNTGRLVDDVLCSKGIAVSRVDMTDPAAVEDAFRPETKVLFGESVTSPFMRLLDVEALARIAHGKGALLIVDNTYLSPALYRPLDLGADLVVESMTKYMSGHGDAVAGSVAGSRDLVLRAHNHQELLGSAPSPFNSWLVLRGLHTLPMRMRVHSDNALALAEFLESDPTVEWVRYTGLPSHPDHALASRCLRRGSGGMLSVRLRGGPEEMSAFVNALHIGAVAVSLGDVKTLVDPMLNRDCFIRVSVGCEDIADLIADFASALETVARTAADGA